MEGGGVHGEAHGEEDGGAGVRDEEDLREDHGEGHEGDHVEEGGVRGEAGRQGEDLCASFLIVF